MSQRLGLLVFAAALATASVASADSIVLRDGTRIEGRVSSLDQNELAIEVAIVGSRTARTVVSRADVVSIALDSPAGSPAPAPEAPVKRTATGSSAGDELEPRTSERPKVLAGRVVFVLDASGSMAIGRRWQQARDLIVELVGKLAPKSEYDVLVFDEGVKSLYDFSWMGTLQGFQDRVRDKLKAQKPNLLGKTDVYNAVVRALERTCDRVIVVSDGVETVDRTSDVPRALAAIKKAAADHGTRLDAYAVQDGRYTAAAVEDKPEAQRLLKQLATASGGHFEALPADEPASDTPHPFKPIEGTIAQTVKVELYDPTRRDEIRDTTRRQKLMGLFPRFAVRVRDKDVLKGNLLDVKEYGGLAWFDIVIKDTDSHEVFSQLKGLTFHREGEWLVSDKWVQVMGALDDRVTKTDDPDNDGGDRGKYVAIEARFGSPFEIHYHRAGETFVERRFIRDAGHMFGD